MAITPVAVVAVMAVGRAGVMAVVSELDSRMIRPL